MIERLKAILNRFLEWWKKFSVKNRIILISVVAAVIMAFVILGVVVSRPDMETLMVCENTAEAAKIIEVLDAAGIESETSEDGLSIRVDKDDVASANVELGANGYPTADYDLETVFSGGFSATETDKQKRYTAYLESKLASDLEAMEVVDEAKVSLSVPEDDGTIIASEEDTFASVSLNLNSEISDEVASGIARFIATAIGNEDTENITIMDYSANLLFAGEADDGTGISSTAMMSQLTKATEQMKRAIKEIFLSQGYDTVTVAPNLKIDTSKTSKTEVEYSAPDGREEGMLSHEDWYTSESVNGIAGTPGTDSNDDTTYVIEDGSESSSMVEEGSKDYLPNRTETITEQSAGQVVYDESSISVVLTSYIYYDEAELEAQGALEGITFDEFVAQNRGRNVVEVDEALYNSVSKATGIAAEDISILAYEEPFFQKATDDAMSVSMILTALMLVLILGLLIFVVFRSSRPVVVEEIETETSVEDLLASTRAEPLEDIEYDDKSEARKMIDKFVDENPEAVAQLLRNWLNEDWE